MGKWNNMLSTYLDSKHVFRGRPQVSGTAFQKCSQPERVYSTESLQDTVFPVLLRTVWKAEVSVSDDVTVSDLGRDKNVSLPTLYLLICVFKTCSMSFVLNVWACYYALNPNRPTLDDSAEFRSHWVSAMFWVRPLRNSTWRDTFVDQNLISEEERANFGMLFSQCE